MWLTFSDLKDIAVRESGITWADLWGPRRLRSDRCVRVRAACVFVAIENGFILTEIAEGLGFEDHTSIMHLRDMAHKWAANNILYGRFIVKLHRLWHETLGVI
jgi:hypothetical protein